MNDLELDIDRVRNWFNQDQNTPYVIVHVNHSHAQHLPNELGTAVRRCYITDRRLVYHSAHKSVPQTDIISAKLPDPGSTMAGDFGEILVYLYQVTREHINTPIGPIKWRLKEDRTKPAPYSDVVQFVLPDWPRASANDLIICAEVKTKSTNSSFEPIRTAVVGINKDRTSRLAKTLVWLRERALTEDLGDIRIAQLERFIDTTKHPPTRKEFQAVAVLSSELVQSEIADISHALSDDYTIVVISVPQLRSVYSSVFDAASAAIVHAQSAMTV